MSKILDIELNEQGVISLLKSKEVLSACEDVARQVQRKAGFGYKISKHVGKNRVNVSVYTKSKKRIQENLKENTLLKVLGEIK